VSLRIGLAALTMVHPLTGPKESTGSHAHADAGMREGEVEEVRVRGSTLVFPD